MTSILVCVWEMTSFLSVVVHVGLVGDVTLALDAPTLLRKGRREKGRVACLENATFLFPFLTESEEKMAQPRVQRRRLKWDNGVPIAINPEHRYMGGAQVRGMVYELTHVAHKLTNYSSFNTGTCHGRHPQNRFCTTTTVLRVYNLTIRAKP